MMDIHENSEKVYMKKSKVIELICAALSASSTNNEIFSIVEKVYGKKFIKSILIKYDSLIKILNALGSKGYELLEFTLISSEFDDIKKYEAYVKSLKDIEFFYYFFGGYIPKDNLKKALENEDNLKDFYYEFNFCCSKFETLKYILLEKENFLILLFDFIKEFHTEKIDKIMNEVNFLYEDFFKIVLEYLEDSSPLEVSQKLMGKTFKNRGPYENFIFIPTFFLPGKAVRFMGNDQILLYKVFKNKEQAENKLKLQQGLKALSDPTRFDILDLLCQNPPMFGKQIAEYMNLSTPTVSHHLDQLKDTGFINEERVKNSKYFSANKINLNEFIELLDKTLNKK